MEQKINTLDAPNQSFDFAPEKATTEVVASSEAGGLTGKVIDAPDTFPVYQKSWVAYVLPVAGTLFFLMFVPSILSSSLLWGMIALVVILAAGAGLIINIRSVRVYFDQNGV